MARIKSRNIVYVSDVKGCEGFETTCKHHADSHDFVHGCEPAIRERLENSGRFTSKSRLDGAVRQQIEDHIWFETNRRRQSPIDYLGIDTPDGIQKPVQGGPPAHALRDDPAADFVSSVESATT